MQILLRFILTSFFIMKNFSKEKRLKIHITGFSKKCIDIRIQNDIIMISNT